MTLKELSVGGSALILEVGGEGPLRQHFLDMGLIPGAHVKLIKYAPMGDPMELKLHGYELTLRLADAELELFIKEGCPKRAGWPGKEAYGLRHLAFRVDSVEDTVRKLNALGIETEPIRCDTFTGEKMTFFHDPDGLPIEIHE